MPSTTEKGRWAARAWSVEAAGATSEAVVRGGSDPSRDLAAGTHDAGAGGRAGHVSYSFLRGAHGYSHARVHSVRGHSGHTVAVAPSSRRVGGRRGFGGQRL